MVRKAVIAAVLIAVWSVYAYGASEGEGILFIEERTAAAQKTEAAIEVPSDLNCEVLTISNDIRLTWNRVKDVSGYNIYRYSTKKDEYVKIDSVSGGKNSYTDKGLKSETLYRYRVCAYKDGSESSLSRSVKAKTYRTYKGIALTRPLKNLSVISSYGMRWGRMHYGNDYRASEGTPVYAAADGVVTESHGTLNTMGVTVKIKHGQGVTTTYGHLSRRLVKKGDKVRAGEKIGEAGATGNAMCSHLHFEVRINGKTFNPSNFY